MSTLTVSSKGQIVLPAALRRRMGMAAGAKVEVLEEADGVKLKVVSPVNVSEVSKLAGMVRAPASGQSRNLDDFDAAGMLARKRPPRA